MDFKEDTVLEYEIKVSGSGSGGAVLPFGENRPYLIIVTLNSILSVYY